MRTTVSELASPEVAKLVAAVDRCQRLPSYQRSCATDNIKKLRVRERFGIKPDQFGGRRVGMKHPRRLQGRVARDPGREIPGSPANELVTLRSPRCLAALAEQWLTVPPACCALRRALCRSHVQDCTQEKHR